jgi:hypothetical protein
LLSLWWNTVTGRRGHPREQIRHSLHGELCLCEIVSVLWVDMPELLVVSREAPEQDEIYGVSLPGRNAWMQACVVASEPRGATLSWTSCAIKGIPTRP